MLKEIQINKTTKKVYAMNESYEVIATFDIGTDFYDGYNENVYSFVNNITSLYFPGSTATISS